MSNTRDELMDYIDDNYNNYEYHQYLEDIYQELFGEMDDSGPEGMFTGLTAQQLQMLANALDERLESTTTLPPRDSTFTFDDDEISVLIVAMENFSDVTWTKDREMSRIAKRILRKLTGRCFMYQI